MKDVQLFYIFNKKQQESQSIITYSHQLYHKIYKKDKKTPSSPKG